MIKVASYNMRKGIGADRRRSPERIMDVLREVDADVIALQEADRRFGARAGVIPTDLHEQLGWEAVGVGLRAASMGWHGNALLVRKGTAVTGCCPIHLPSLEPRGAVSADLSLRGTSLRVIGMHLDLSGLWRRRQAAAIIDHVETASRRLPTIMMGDLNEWRATGGALNDFATLFQFAATGPSFHARRPLGRLDRIMVSRSLRVIDCGVHASATARVASDHLPIWATIEPAAQPA